MPSTDMRAVEWDPNDWKWDGDLFIATPLYRNSSDYRSRQLFPIENGVTVTVASSNSSSSCSDELNHKTAKENRELEKKRRVSVVESSSLTEEAAGTLTLKLGGRGYDIGDCYGTAGKKTKLGGASTPNRAVCQVEDCGADLSKAKDYHRRHKVCEAHSKASRALVGNHMQRFCQQCSRFHALQEFDEGKRSCRRRLAGHNKRRRKTQPDNVGNNSPVDDNHGSGYLLVSILKILSNMHSNRLNHTDDPDLLSYLLHGLSGQGSFHQEINTSRHPLEFQNLLNNLTSLGNSELVSALLSNASLGTQPTKQNCINPGEEMRKDGELQATTSQSPGIVLSIQSNSQNDAGGRGTSAGRCTLNDFDLNDVYVDSDDGMDDAERSTVPLGLGTVSTVCPSWVQQESHQSSPPQTSGNSDSASAQSPSSSSGDIQGRTDRIVFKLFGKEPSDFPIVLRAQIFDWLSNSPTDIESYIRPGCVILTIYLRLSESSWEELCCDLRSSLSRLLDFNDNIKFWRTGWIYMRVRNQMAFVYNGQVVVDTSLPCWFYDNSTILSVTPVAVASSGHARFVVKGSNLSLPSTRLLCALEGNYLEADTKLVEHVDGLEGFDVQSLDIACFIPSVTGRGFIEVEDRGLSMSFFPFIVAEDEVCCEIRMLEKEIELTDIHNLHRGTGKFDARDKALEFLNEMGWLLHKFQSQSQFGHSDPNLSFFPFKRFKYLIEFSMDRDWCAVVKKLLDILFNGTVSAGDQPLLKLALSELGLLHRAVRKNSRSLVEMLLRYVPEKVADGLNLEYKSLVEIENFLFRPDVAGAGGLTPLHVAAGRDGSDDVLEALINDPRKVGIGAWKSAVDSTGFTPEDYARLRGHYSYIHLVQRKINKKISSGHVLVCISDNSSDSSINQKLPVGVHAASVAGFEIQQSCGICNQKLANGAPGSSTLLYRPAMLSMVAIAAVCVCVALFFKSLQVLHVFSPFRWEMLEYGSS